MLEARDPHGEEIPEKAFAERGVTVSQDQFSRDKLDNVTASLIIMQKILRILAYMTCLDEKNKRS